MYKGRREEMSFWLWLFNKLDDKKSIFYLGWFMCMASNHMIEGLLEFKWHYLAFGLIEIPLSLGLIICFKELREANKK